MQEWKRLAIEKLVYGGWGLARSDENVIFVARVIPGEIVDAQQTGMRAHCPFAEIVRFDRVSPSRIDPPCKYFDSCGGCDWQFMSYDEQVRQKKLIFEECLRRQGKLASWPEVEVYADKEWAYRIRVQFKVDHDAGAVGFFRRASNQVVDLETCPLLVPALNSILLQRREIANSLSRDLTEVRCLAGDKFVASDVAGYLAGCHAHTTIKVSDKTMRVGGHSFFQSNLFLLEKLGTWAHEDLGGKLCVDLYGGVGLFSLMHGEKFAQGVLVECVNNQVTLAKRNFSANRLNNFVAKSMTAEKYLAAERKQIDTLIVDPPRPGLTRRVRLSIAKSKPSQILYIACNPATQARDAGYFVNKCGYRIKRAALFDLYPQTHHLESGLLLEYMHPDGG
ncbi:MAG: hypothetical protein GF398_21720 [Chitinivibrionales bacterium]|nr:hypothetical protein [Chitinivibrionales bacterium]